MSETAPKPYKGRNMEGFLATWYARQTERDRDEHTAAARRIAAHLGAGSRVLEVAPGPGYLAIALAVFSGASVTGLDISRTFVRIATDNAREAGVRVDFEQGDAADLPFPDGRFDFVVCRAAFKNFSRPLVALNEMYRVLKPGGTALIIDLRKDFSGRALSGYLKGRGWFDALVMRIIFNTMLKHRAYTRESMAGLVAQSEFGRGEIRLDPIGFEAWLHKGTADAA